MSACVVIVHLHSREDVIAILEGEMDGKIRVEHPYYIAFNPQSSSIVMVPYCPYTDEIYYHIDRSKVDYVVVANEDITRKFLHRIDLLEQNRHIEALEEDSYIDQMEAAMSENTFVQGNETIH